MQPKSFAHRERLTSAPADGFIEVLRDTNKDIGAVPEYLPLNLLASGGISGAVTKSLDAAGGGDFTTWAEVWDWIQNTSFNGADITLNVAAGTYTMPDETIEIGQDRGIWNFDIVGADMATTIFKWNTTTANLKGFRFVSIDVSIVSVTLEADAASADVWALQVEEGCYFYSRYITGTALDSFMIAYGSWVSMRDVDITAPTDGFDSAGITADTGTTMELRDVTIDGIDDTTVGVDVRWNSALVMRGTCVIDNVDIGIKVLWHCKIFLQAAPTITAVTADYYDSGAAAAMAAGKYTPDGSIVIPATGIAQSGTGETVGFTAGAGSAVLDDSTFTGNVGATAYRISDIVKALKNLGLLAA